MRTIALIGVTGLAGCGSIGGDSGANFQGIYDAEIAMNSAVSAMPATTSAAMPTASSATYKGYVSFYSFYPLVLGDMTLTADFANKTLSGSITNLVNGDDEKVPGSGSIGASISGAAISGTYSGSGTSAGDTFTITDQPVKGEFRGASAEAVYLTFSGQGTSSASTTPVSVGGTGAATR